LRTNFSANKCFVHQRKEFCIHLPCWRAVTAWVHQDGNYHLAERSQTTAAFSNKSFSLLQFLIIRFAVHKTLLKENKDLCHSKKACSVEKKLNSPKKTNLETWKFMSILLIETVSDNSVEYVVRDGTILMTSDPCKLHVVGSKRKTEI